jgi:sec-independent protein translocase protein TatA
MNFLGLGPGELALIAILGLIVFGPGKLPEIASQIGRTVRDFRRSTADITAEFQRSFSLDELSPPEAAVGAAQVFASSGVTTETIAPLEVTSPPPLVLPPATPVVVPPVAELPAPADYPSAASEPTATLATTTSDSSTATSFWDWERPHLLAIDEPVGAGFWAWPEPPVVAAATPNGTATAETALHRPGPLETPSAPTLTLPADLV